MWCRMFATNVHNAGALENALLWVMIAAMLSRAVVYGALYFTLPRDMKALKENRAVVARPSDPESDLTGERPKLQARPVQLPRCIIMHAKVQCIERLQPCDAWREPKADAAQLWVWQTIPRASPVQLVAGRGTCLME